MLNLTNSFILYKLELITALCAKSKDNSFITFCTSDDVA